jgi:hypothetical protein
MPPRFHSPIAPRRTLLLLAPALFALVFAAVYAGGTPRVDYYDASHVYTPCIYIPPGREHWALAGCSGTSRVGTHQAVMRFNSEGLRDKEYREWPEKGTYRVLVLGSSNTLGPGIEEEATYPRQLESELRKAGKRVEVINAAMVGYCTIQASFRLRELLERYSPNLVLYQFVQGSCPLFDGAWESRVEMNGATPVRIERSPFDPAGKFSFLNALTYRFQPVFFVWLTAADQLRKAAFSRMVARIRDPAERVAAYLGPTLKFLTYMRDTARAKNAGFLVVSYRMKPFTQSIPASFYGAVARPLSVFVRAPEVRQSEMFDFLHARGIDAYWGSFASRDYLLSGDVHLSEQGLALLAKETAAVIAPLAARNLANAEPKPNHSTAEPRRTAK